MGGGIGYGKSVFFRAYAARRGVRHSGTLTADEQNIRTICERSLYAFVREAWPHCEGGEFVDGMHIHAVCAHLQALEEGTITRLIINQPPRCSKSLLSAVFFPAWLFVRDPSDSVMSVSYAKQLSVRDSTKCRRLIQSPWYQKLWGHKVRLTEDMNQKTRFDTTAGGHRIANSMLSSNTGEGANYLVIDDPNNIGQMRSPLYRENCVTYFDEVLSTRRLADPDRFRMVVVQQRCFMPGTKVSVPGGGFDLWAVPIESLRPGNQVLCFNPETDRVEKGVVTAVMHHRARYGRIMGLEQEDGSWLMCTPEHKMWSCTQGSWVEAQNLTEDDVTLRLQRDLWGGWDLIPWTCVPAWREDYGGEVWNITVEPYHNYFAESVLVKNCHQQDVSGSILSKNDSRWVHLRLPMEYEADNPCRTVPLFDPGTGEVKVWEDPRTKDGELLWPEMLGEEDVRLLKEKDFRGDPYLIAGQLQQRPSTRGGQIFRDDWFPVWTWPGLPPFDYVVASWDTALTGKSKSAFSACVVFGVFRNNLGVQNSLILSVYQERIEFPELKDMALRLYKNCFDTDRLAEKPWPGAFHADVVLVEGKASGYSLIQELERMGLPVLKFDPGRYGDKETRARRVADVCEAGQVWLHGNGMGEIPDGYGQALLKELRVFPSGETMDVVDAFSQGLIHLKERNMLYLHGFRPANT